MGLQIEVDDSGDDQAQAVVRSAACAGKRGDYAESPTQVDIDCPKMRVFRPHAFQAVFLGGLPG
jgi:hypothetical protein